MIIDLLLAIAILFAVIKGYKRGLIVGVFSFVAVFIGLAAAIKLSAVVAGYIGSTVNVSEKWLPILSFIIVFIVVIILVRLGANALEKTIQFALLGWINKLGGIILYAALYITIFSVVIFYSDKAGLIKPQTKDASVAYSYIAPIGPKAIDAFGKFIPIFKDMFKELEDFFGNLSHEIPKK
ncbi:MAG: CvpA family protein [Bacteroidetes bacterium]|nr:CvpA family protein [Bacteroidota bacterium]